MNDYTAIQSAQRHAYDELKKGRAVGRAISPVNISMPSFLRQEKAFASTTSVYYFEFGSTAPVSTTALDNVNLGDNDIFAVYGIQILLGEGADQTNRVYRSRGLTPSDNCLYSGNLAIQFESRQYITRLPMLQFKEETDNFYDYAGMQLINPLRIIKGSIAKWQVIIDCGDISGMTLTSNLYISVLLHGAQGTP